MDDCLDCSVCLSTYSARGDKFFNIFFPAWPPEEVSEEFTGVLDSWMT